MKKKVTESKPKQAPRAKKPVVAKPEETVNLEETVTPSLSGLGDVIGKVTDALGITPCEDCLKRKAALNKMFPFLKTVKRDLTEEEIVLIQEYNTIKKVTDSKMFVQIFNSVFGTKAQPCNCPAVYKGYMQKLLAQIENQKIKV